MAPGVINPSCRRRTKACVHRCLEKVLHLPVPPYRPAFVPHWSIVGAPLGGRPSGEPAARGSWLGWQPNPP